MGEVGGELERKRKNSYVLMTKRELNWFERRGGGEGLEKGCRRVDGGWGKLLVW